MDLTDEQGEVLGPLIPEPPRRADGRGRLWRDAREVLNGIPWVLRRPPGTTCPTAILLTCHRRFQCWIEEGVLSGILEGLAEDLEERGALDLSERFIDGTFMVTKKGDHRWERPSEHVGGHEEPTIIW